MYADLRLVDTGRVLTRSFGPSLIEPSLCGTRTQDFFDGNPAANAYNNCFVVELPRDMGMMVIRWAICQSFSPVILRSS